MTQRITITQPAPAGSRFASDAFARQVGKRLPFKIDGRIISDCEVIAATVVSDGAAVEITLGIPTE